MKVGGASKPKGGETVASAGQGASKGATVSGTSGASQTFAEVAEDMEVRAIIDELDDIGAALSKYPSTVLLSRYKELVRMALGRVKNNMHIKREFKWRRTER
jgi:uncharacterized protein YaaR (DUF327 family)